MSELKLTKQERAEYWSKQHLQVVKNLNIETMKERFVIATMLEDGSSAKLGSNGEALTFETEELANEYIKDLRGSGNG